MPSRARAIVDEALALRESHPHAPAADVLDLAMQGHQVWLEDFFAHMVPPSAFAPLVSEYFTRMASREGRDLLNSKR